MRGSCLIEGQECELSVGVQIAYRVQREWFGKKNLFKIMVKDRWIGKRRIQEREKWGEHKIHLDSLTRAEITG
jgi:hypothetical protein